MANYRLLLELRGMLCGYLLVLVSRVVRRPTSPTLTTMTESACISNQIYHTEAWHVHRDAPRHELSCLITLLLAHCQPEGERTKWVCHALQFGKVEFRLGSVVEPIVFFRSLVFKTATTVQREKNSHTFRTPRTTRARSSREFTRKQLLRI